MPNVVPFHTRESELLTKLRPSTDENAWARSRPSSGGAEALQAPG